jgi:inward rectifier potassium channel
MLEKLKQRISRSHVIAFGDREIVTEGLNLSFWADISHRSMTASWPSFIASVVLVFVVFNAAFGLLYWLGDEPVSNVARNDYLDYVYFSIETLSTAGYGDMHPQTHYGHFVSAVELLTGIFSMSLFRLMFF